MSPNTILLLLIVEGLGFLSIPSDAAASDQVLLPAAPYNRHYWQFNLGLNFWDWEQGVYVRFRMIDMTRMYYEEGVQRVKRLNLIRAKYQETPLYELGYVIGEIIERYRKMIDLAKHLDDYKSEILIKRAALLNIMEQTYLEMYHIYNIFNEIPRKYAYMPEYRNISALFDATIEALVQTCDEYDTTCKTNETMTNVWEVIRDEREREALAREEYKKNMRKLREEFFKAFLNGTLDELKIDFASRNITYMAGTYDLDHVPPGHIAAGPGVHQVYSNQQKGFENLISWKRPARPKKRRPYPLEYGWSNEDMFFEGWKPNEVEGNRSYDYLHYVPTTASTVPVDSDEDEDNGTLSLKIENPWSKD